VYRICSKNLGFKTRFFLPNGALTIDDLPDDVLLAIFDFYVVGYQDLYLFDVTFDDQGAKSKINSWQTLVHVCRRWRCLVFGSPRRLKLQLCCTRGITTSARKSLDVWPALPLLIKGFFSESSVDDIIADLKHSDRICQINLKFVPHAPIKKLWTATQVPFPELVLLYLSFGDFWGGPGPVLPDSFFGGSVHVPRLRFLKLTSITFPGLPKLLLSPTHLVLLSLCNIPNSGYISPEAMAACLSMLTSLERLQLEFEPPQSSPDQENRRSPPRIRFVLPSLTFFLFQRGERILGGPFVPDRCPSSRPVVDKVF
jgi:F-box-like